MTYLKTTLIASALTAATSTAAFAGGDKMHKTTNAVEKTTVTTTAPMTEVRGATTLTQANDTVGEILQADGQKDTQKDFELLTHDGDMLTKSEAKSMDSDKMIANNAIVVPSSTGAITTVSCPIGTTAQPDMTCHVTGNYSLEKSEALRKEEVKSESQVLGAVEYDVETTPMMEKTHWDRDEIDPANWNSQASSTTYIIDTEYKGTLRPDTVVVDNVED